MVWADILEELKKNPTVSVPVAGAALANMAKNAAYNAAARGKLGVEVFDVGGKKRVASMAVLRRLGLVDGGVA